MDPLTTFFLGPQPAISDASHGNRLIVDKPASTYCRLNFLGGLVFLAYGAMHILPQLFTPGAVSFEDVSLVTVSLGPLCIGIASWKYFFGLERPLTAVFDKTQGLLTLSHPAVPFAPAEKATCPLADIEAVITRGNASLGLRVGGQLRPVFTHESRFFKISTIAQGVADFLGVPYEHTR